MAVTDIRVGACSIKQTSTLLGMTDEEGPVFSVPGHEYVDIMSSEHGVNLLNQIDIGQREVKVKFNLLENTHATRLLVSPLGTELTSNTVTEGKTPGTSMLALADEVTFHPYRLGAADVSLDIVFHKMIIQWKGDYAQGDKNVQMLVCEGIAYYDTSGTDGNRIWKIGGASS